MEAVGLEQILQLAAGTSPLVALLVWIVHGQGKRNEQQAQLFADTTKTLVTSLTDKTEKVAVALHDVDKRLAVIENFVEYNTATATRKLNAPT